MIFKRKISDWQFIFFIGLIIFAPLSKYPSISLPLFNFPSFRIGLYQILSLVFVLLCARSVYTAGTQFFISKNRVAYIALIVFGIIAFASIAWSLYPARSLLLASSIGLLLLTVICAWWFVATQFSRQLLHKTIQIILYATVLYSVIAAIQLIIFTFTNQTLGTLCTGCTATVFGFPRINVFAAEPQFFANSLLPFVFVALYALFTTPTKLAWAALIGAVGSIGLTFSRGALFALVAALGIVAILLYTYKRVSIRRIVTAYSVICLSLCASFVLLVGSATIRYANTPNITYETVDSILEHLTIRIINLPESTTISAPLAPIPSITPDVPQNSPINDTFVSPGLIESSGNERLGAAKLALQAWRDSPITTVFGVGIGNLGPYVVSNIDPTAPSTLTVYIYYILLLAELGVVGISLFIAIFVATTIGLLRVHRLGDILLFGLLAAFLLQFLFFGSYINVMYIWLWAGIALGAVSIDVKKLARKRGIIRI